MPSRFHRLFTAGVVMCGAVLAAPVAVGAHTGVDFTLPTDGASVGTPVSEITVAFTEPVTLVGPGFEVLDPQGRLSTPFVVTDDDVVFRLPLEPPLAGGVVGVRYEVASLDGHVVSGAFSFTVAVEAPATTVSPTSTVPEVTATSTPASGTAPTRPTVPATTEPAGSVPTGTRPTSPPPTTGSSATVPSSTSGGAGERTSPSDDGGSGTTIILLGVGGLIAAAIAFVLFRQRGSA